MPLFVTGVFLQFLLLLMIVEILMAVKMDFDFYGDVVYDNIASFSVAY